MCVRKQKVEKTISGFSWDGEEKFERRVVHRISKKGVKAILAYLKSINRKPKKRKVIYR